METYNGHVRTPADAIILFEACRLGHLPRVQRRLSEKERQQIKSGSVFVWDEREAGMRRWTDGKSWSASRVSGSFLTYREMEGKRGGNSFSPHVGSAKRTPNGNYKDPVKSDTEMDMSMADDGPDGYRYKPDGLMKQSFSITTSQGQHLHLISYYARSHPSAASLVQPTSDASLRHIRPAKGMYPETTLQDGHQMPAVTRSPMIGSPYGASPYAPSPSQMSSHSSYSRRSSYQHHALAAPPGHGGYIPPSPMQSPHASHHPYANGEYRSPQSSTNSPMYHQSHYPPHLRPASGPTAFDRPPTSTLPPPPPMPHHHHPPQPYNGYASSPATSSYPAPHSHYQHASATSHPYSHPPPPPPPPAQHQTHSPPGHPVAPYRRDPPPPYNRTSSPSSSHSEPRMGQASHGFSTTLDQRNEAPPLRPFPSPESQKDTDTHAPPPTKTIPSIGSLINTSPPPPAPRPDPILGHLHGRSTPPGSEMSKQLAYGEDKRALSKLDKAFST